MVAESEYIDVLFAGLAGAALTYIALRCVSVLAAGQAWGGAKRTCARRLSTVQEEER